MTLDIHRQPTELDGVFRLTAGSSEDERGAFSRLFDANVLGFHPVQVSGSDNRKKGTLRGLHFMAPPHEETKVVQVISGRIFDVAVDLRAGSPQFGRWQGLELSQGEGVYIPRGFAHGFLTLEDASSLIYFMDTPFVAGAASGTHHDQFGIAWPEEVRVISARDRALPRMG